MRQLPTEVNPLQEDTGEVEAGTGADGLGDACDPRPTLDGDFVARFDAFDQMPPGYMLFGPAMLRGDALELGSISVPGQAVFSAPAAFTRAAWSMNVTSVAPTQLVYGGLWSEVSNGNLTE